MSFDIKKYCHISHVVHHKGKEKLVFDHNGVNLFLVVKGSCTTDGHGSELNVKKRRDYMLRRPDNHSSIR